MSASVHNDHQWVRNTGIAADLFLISLLVAVLLLAAGLLSSTAASRIGNEMPTARLAALPEITQPELPSVVTASSVAATKPDEAPVEALTPHMLAALDHVARRYRISPEALRPIFQVAQLSGRERKVDALLIVAIIGVESRFNPFSESAMGALGLMQIMPRYHQDKLPSGAGNARFLDPVLNIRIGTHILDESIRRQGDLIAGLQQFGGALNDEQQTYANKVLAEKERLEQAASRSGNS